VQAETENLIAVSRASADVAASELDHEAWTSAQPVLISRYWSGAEAPPERRAEARLLWSTAALHVRFVCPQLEPLVVSATPQTGQKSLGLWDRDVCEIFIATDASRPESYYEFEAAPTGEWLDLKIHWTAEARETDWEYHSGMTTGASIGARRVRVAMRIPWEALDHSPQAGQLWRANLFRCVGADPHRGYLAWQPTHTPEPSFHLPQAFGWLRFEE
jgi:hypothetical protein